MCLNRTCFLRLCLPWNHLLHCAHCTFSSHGSPRCSFMWRSIDIFVRNVLPQVAQMWCDAFVCICEMCTFSA
uniref:Putative secreted protein n=1 Tax=Anopheles marajoara TaxID=58244 RepID=A0A2M4CDV2_9DIPT